MWMNLDQIPAGSRMYTLAVTSMPAGTLSADLFYDEVDVVAPSHATVPQIIAAADLEGYEHCRIIGISNQSDGYVICQDPNGDFR